MQFTLFTLALASLAVVNGASIEARGGSYHHKKPKWGGGGGKAPAPVAVCPAGESPLCCQLDVLGVVDATCLSAGTPKSLTAFEATCAASGRTAECCTLAAGGIGLICEEAA